jgi:hypothetical protein
LPSVSDYTERAVGSESPDTSFFYKGETLYDVAQSYGEAGRGRYIFLRWTFDLVWPLVYLLFLVSVTAQLCKAYNKKWLNYIIWLPIVATVFDYIENSLLTIFMMLFPSRIFWLGTLAGLATVIKWTLLYLSFALIFFLLFFISFHYCLHLKKKH